MLHTAWEHHGGTDSEIQSTGRKRNLNFTIPAQRKLPYVVCLFKSSRKEGPWTAKYESCHGSKVLIHLIHPDTPGKVQELMKFRKLPDMIPIALFEANCSILSHLGHLVLEAIGSTVVRGKGTELYELLVWFDFAFLCNLFSKPNHCFINNFLVSMKFVVHHPRFFPVLAVIPGLLSKL